MSDAGIWSALLDVENGCEQLIGPTITTRVPPRDKRIRYDENLLPILDPKKEYSAADIVTASMKVFARDSRVVSIDSDLATTYKTKTGLFQKFDAILLRFNRLPINVGNRLQTFDLSKGAVPGPVIDNRCRVRHRNPERVGKFLSARLIDIHFGSIVDGEEVYDPLNLLVVRLRSP